ncbi:hypothetical protein QCA50_007774 [Cerrena zonata]|uniref:Rhodanese domain-containing protein n=1 Tax=Cerrena zonata TaxID=2478898 RepID=A0AAW0G6V7_9APHY
MSGHHEHPVEIGEREPIHEHESGEIDPTELEERPGHPEVNIPVPSAFTDILHISGPTMGKLKVTKPQNTPESDVERQAKLQEILGKATTEAIVVAQNTSHIGSFARKTIPSTSMSPNLAIWKAFSKGPGSDPHAYTIPQEQMKAFLRANPDPQKNNYAIIDLRAPKDFDKNGRHIKGALHWPVTEEGPGLDTKYGLTFSGSARSTGRTAQPQQIAGFREKWRNLLPTQPWNTLQGKDVVFFHCAASANRTPHVATGYLEYGRPVNSDQKVVIIEQGYSSYDWGDLTEPYQLV